MPSNAIVRVFQMQTYVADSRRQREWLLYGHGVLLIRLYLAWPKATFYSKTSDLRDGQNLIGTEPILAQLKGEEMG
jgi:hypothetical protein